MLEKIVEGTLNGYLDTTPIIFIHLSETAIYKLAFDILAAEKNQIKMLVILDSMLIDSFQSSHLCCFVSQITDT